jgi:anti-sigma B factor antagonist
MRDASAGALNVTVDQRDGAVVIRAEGEVDLGNAEKLSAALRMGGAEDASRRVVLDLLGVPFMDSSGLKALLIGSAELGGRLSLVLSPGAPVARLLDLAEVRDRFVIHETVEAAVGGSTGDPS